MDKEFNKQKYLRFDYEISSWKKVAEERNRNETLEAIEERKVKMKLNTVAKLNWTINTNSHGSKRRH